MYLIQPKPLSAQNAKKIQPYLIRFSKGIMMRIDRDKIIKN